MVNPGIISETEIRKSLEMMADQGYDMFYQKEVDTNSLDYSMWCNYCGKKNYHDLITPKVASDFYIVNDFGTHRLEVKSYRGSATSYPIAYIAQHQLEWGLRLHSYDYNTYYFVFINRHDRQNIRAYLLSAFDVDTEIANADRKSILWTSFARYTPLARVPKGRWDLAPYMDLIFKKKEIVMEE